MLREILSVGDKIDVRQLDQTGRPMSNVKTYVSQLLDFVDFDVIHIATPIGHGRTIILSVGENYNLCFYSNKSLYQCNCLVLSNHKDNNTIVAVVRITTNLEKLQRRQYYRLECIHEIEYRIITREDEILDRKLKLEDFRNSEERAECRKRLSQLDKDWIKASVTDLSGGGAKFNSSLEHIQGDKVRLKLDLLSGGDLKKMVLGADIISTNRLLNGSGTYEHRVEFSDIMQKDRELLIKYIFEQERRRRRNDKN